jgi:hypothetical protein
VRFWRHLAVVAVVVAAVVAVGVAWEHSSEADWITPPGPPGAARVAGFPPGQGEVVRLAPGTSLPPGVHLPAGVQVVRTQAGGENGAGLDLSDVADLTRTVEIMAAVMAGVVVLDVARRRLRRLRRLRRAGE